MRKVARPVFFDGAEHLMAVILKEVMVQHFADLLQKACVQGIPLKNIVNNRTAFVDQLSKFGNAEPGLVNHLLDLFTDMKLRHLCKSAGFSPAVCHTFVQLLIHFVLFFSTFAFPAFRFKSFFDERSLSAAAGKTLYGRRDK